MTTPFRPFPRRDAALAAVLVASLLLVYAPALTGGRLLDDDLHITPPGLRSLAGLGRIWFSIGATQQYYPVLHSAFWMEHRLWGGHLAGYHLVNVLLHAVSALLVAALMRRLRLPGAWLAAFLFALHPVCVESVAWMAEQKNTLSTALALGAAVVYLGAGGSGRPARYGLASSLFALAVLSKTAVVTVPILLAAALWWRRPDFGWRRDARPLAPWLGFGAVASLATLLVEHRLLSGVRGDFVLGPVARCLLAGRVFWFYLGKLVFPAGLTFFYPRWTIDAGEPWQYLFPLAAAALAAVCWRQAGRGGRGPMAALLCFAGALLPVLGFFNVEWFVFSYVADHLQYLAVAVFVVPASAALAGLVRRLPPAIGRLGPAAGCGLAAALGALSWGQSGRYRDAETLYRTAVRLNPSSAAAHNNLGAALAAMPGRDAEAIAQFEAALRINPRVAEGQENLGNVLMRDPARFDEAVARLEAARALDPARKSVHDKLAFALADRPGRSQEAIAEYEASLRLDPSDPEAHNGLGRILMRDPRRLEEAEAEFEAALRLKPDFAEARNNLGDVWMKMPGRLLDARRQIEEALRLDPNLADAHNNLGLALARSGGSLDDAIAEFQAAIRLDPRLAAARCNLGLALTLVPGRLPDAVAELREGLRLDPDFAPGWQVLGESLLRAGDTAGAAAAFENELRLQPGNEAARRGLAAALGRGEGP